MPFEVATAARILFGAGTAGEVSGAAGRMGRRILLVTGRDRERARRVCGDAAAVFAVAGEPTVGVVREGVGVARGEACDVVVAIGGGSAIDAGKAIAALAANSGEPLDYLEVVGRGQILSRPSLPFIAVPTTAGAGSEVTRNAVLGSPEHGVKASLRSPYLLPRLAVVDPELAYGLPPAVTAATGLDALTQLIEPYVSARANAFTDMICREGIPRGARSLARAWRDGRDAEARAAMAMASLLGGMALANAGLGAVHGFAAPVGGEFPAPHGAVCAALLPHVMAANIRALRSRPAESAALERYGSVAKLVTGDSTARPENGAAWVARLREELEIPPLRTYGIGPEHVPGLVSKARQASSMKGNPIALTEEELGEILSNAL